MVRIGMMAVHQKHMISPFCPSLGVGAPLWSKDSKGQACDSSGHVPRNHHINNLGTQRSTGGCLSWVERRCKNGQRSWDFVMAYWNISLDLDLEYLSKSICWVYRIFFFIGHAGYRPNSEENRTYRPSKKI